MRQLVSTVIAVHWAAVFGLLSFLCVADPQAGPAGALRVFGLAAVEEGAAASPGAAALLGMPFALTALLFVWMLAACLSGRAGARVSGIVPIAFGSGLAGLLLLFCVAYSAVPEGGGLLPGVEAVVAALAASYVAARVEHAPIRAGEESGSEAVARLMALEAAGDTLLARLSGRVGDAPLGRL